VLEEPLHTFSTPGTYEVKLVARNGCACADTTSLTVVVSDAEITEIQCVGPICRGDSATYRTNIACTNYQWSISPNGSIIGGGSPADDYLTVRWNSGNTGTVELSVSSCTGNVCDKPVRAVVSILGGPVVIDGPDIVCPSTEAVYAIPDFQGSDIVWAVSGYGNLIAEGQGSNKITVKWGSTGGTVSVNYNNCFLDCAGSGQKQVQVKPPSYIDGPIEICKGDNPKFRHKSLTNNSLLSASWKIFDAAGMTVWTSSGNSIEASPTWNFAPGQYTIQAIPSTNSGGSCSAEAGLPITLFAPPAAPSISGTVEVCPTEIYTYSAQSSLSSAEFEWLIVNGGSLTTKTGSSINVKWGNNPPYELSVRQTDGTGPGCQSPAGTLTVQALPTLAINGPSLICKESTATYSTELYQGIDYQWLVVPPSAGAVLSGQGSTSVEVFWQTPGTANLKLLACGVETAFPVEITAPIAPQINHPDSLCPGGTAAVSVLGNYVDFVWKDIDGTTVGTSPMPNLGPGHYRLETTDAAGCKSDNSFFIAPLPAPSTKILAQRTSLCLGPIELSALQTADGYSFQWLRNGQPVGSDEPTFEATLPGSYRVQVTDERGCSFLSDPIQIIECPPAGGGGGDAPPSPPYPPGSNCVTNGSLYFDTETLGSCDSVRMINFSTDLVPNSQVWFVKNGLGANWESSTDFEPTFVFDEPGFYRVVLYGLLTNANDPNGQACPQFIEKTITVPLVAKFDAVESCVGLPTGFTDLSSFMPNTSITAWSWDFGEPASGAANASIAQHPTHVFGQMGNYLVRLTVTSSTGCEVVFEKSVTVHGLPAVSFDPPAANCAASALGFTAEGTDGAISYAWDFGDPASGAGNFSRNRTTWHAYPAAANYEVTVTAANIYGCTDSYTASVAIEANDLVGEITPNDPDPICEGVAAAFTAPSGGSSWSWSNGATSSSITTSAAGIYTVTITDSEGCVYTPKPVLLEMIPAPVATIRAVKLNEFGQPVAYFDQSYTACEGEDIYLEMNGDHKFEYVWSVSPPLGGVGGGGEELVFAQANGSLLPTGQHSFSVTVTDTDTGCTSVEGPFPVTVNGAPTSVAIASTPSGPLCDGTEAIFSVANPQPDLAYLWNTGAQGPTMAAAAAGSYLVVATNQYGCKAKSNDIEIHNVPSVGSVPTGCHNRCNPTDICLPQLPEVADYQWFLNGTAIPAPNGTVANLMATESGDYQVQMTSIHGCVSRSGPLSLSLEAPTGDIYGTVWLDANDNGLIDQMDTPLGGVGVLLSQNGSAVSDLSGGFFFDEIPSESYSVQLDTANLPAVYLPLIFSAETVLEGCHDTASVAFLVKDLCPAPLTSTVQLSACEGSSVVYNGESIPAGGSQEFLLPSANGCDSVVTVNVVQLSPSAGSMALFGCPGDSVFFASQMVAVGDSMVVVLQNFMGCDSVLTVSVAAYPADIQYLALMGCPGEPITYGGTSLLPGDTATFVYPNSWGCDSMVVVTAALFQGTSPTVMEMVLCPGDSLVYNGEVLRPGDLRNYVFQDENGCDSLVSLSVLAYPEIAFELFSDAICPGTKDGQIELDISAGDGPMSAALDGENFASTDSFVGLTGGNHLVQVQDVHGCIASQIIEIQAFEPLILAGEDYVLPCDELHITLRPTVLSHHGPLHWQWPDGSTKDWFHAEQAGLFAVSVSDDCSTESQLITVNWGNDSPADQFYVPNAFSPNSDGINDVFKVYPAQGVVTQYFEFAVFDRWGALLFQTGDPRVGWDGFFNDKPMDTGVVVWYLSANVTVCGREMEVFKEGGVTVMR
jgi:gliding motility-associated-like protein